jgi:hypothetical protein
VIGRAGSGQVLLHYRDARTSMSSLIDARFSIASAAHGFHVSVVKLVETPQPLGVRSCSPTSQFCGRMEHPTCVWSSLRYGTQRRRRSVQSYDARARSLHDTRGTGRWTVSSCTRRCWNEHWTAGLRDVPRTGNSSYGGQRPHSAALSSEVASEVASNKDPCSMSSCVQLQLHARGVWITWLGTADLF